MTSRVKDDLETDKTRFANIVLFVLLFLIYIKISIHVFVDKVYPKFEFNCTKDLQSW